MKKVIKKSLTAFFAVVILFGSLAVGGEGFTELLDSLAIKAEAATQLDVTVEQALNWVFDNYQHPELGDYNGVYKGECVSLVKRYTYYALNLRTTYTVTGNAYGFDQTPFIKSNFDILYSGNPKPGDIFVYYANAQYGGYTMAGDTGHCGIVVEVGSNKYGFVDWNHKGTAWQGQYSYRYVKSTDSSAKALDNYSYLLRPKFKNSHTCDYKASAKIIKAPTKTATGTRERTCSCGKIHTQTIPAIPYTTSLAEGIYTITTKCNTSLKLASSSQSAYNYNVFIADNSYADQYWLFRKNSDGTYTIENAVYDNKVLDVEGLSMVNDGNIFAYNYTGADNQKFYIVPTGSYYKLVAKNSYLNVDNYCAGTTSGNNVIQYEDNGNDAQKWIIAAANPALNLSATSLSMNAGASKSVTCSIGRDTNGVVFECSNSNTSVCSTSWGTKNGMQQPLTVTGKSGGSATLTIKIKDSGTGIIIASKTVSVTVINPKPSASISSTNNVAASQTVTLSMTDNAGLAGYYWGTSSTYTNNTYTAISGTSKSVTKTVSSHGVYYLTVKDTSGNIYTADKQFYRTTLNANGGSVSPASAITMWGNSFALPTPAKSGYSFTGWNTNSSGTGTNYAAGASYKPTGNVTLYAVWKANDTTKPSASISSTNNVAASQTVMLSMSDNVGLAGYYWGTSSTYTNNTYTAISGTSKSVTKTVSSHGVYYLTVKDTSGNIYTADKQFYKTTLNANGGSVSPASVITMWGISFALPTPAKSGYSFTGWNTNSSGTGTNYAAGASYIPTGNVTLYAQWTLSTYTVVFNKNGGSSGSTESQTFTYNEEAKLNKNGFHKYTGADVWYEYNGATGGENNIIFTAVYREFLGWSKSPTGPVQYKDEEIVKNLATSGTVTLYAIWSTEKTMYRLPEPTKTGYIFMGWNTKADGSGENYSAGTIYTPDEDCTLYAQWKPVNVTPTKYVCEKCGAEFTDKNEFIIHNLNHAVEDLEKWPEIHIKNSVKSRTESYGTTITFTATTTYLPENSSIHWFINGRDSGTGEKYTVNKAKNSYTVQAKIIDESGVVRSESETETVNINTSFWSKIVYFFKNLFHRLPVIVQSIDE